MSNYEFGKRGDQYVVREPGGGWVDTNEYTYNLYGNVKRESPVSAGLIAMGEGFAKAADKIPGVNPQFASEQSMQMLNEEYPVATSIGKALPYFASLPLSGGLPAMAALGSAEGYLFSEEGEGAQDAMLGFVGAGAGHMAGRILDGIRSYFKADNGIRKTAGQQLGKPEGIGDKLAKNIYGGEDAAKRFGERNQIMLNRKILKAAGLDAIGSDRITDSMVSLIEKNAPEVAAVVKATRKGDNIDMEKLTALAVDMHGKPVTKSINEAMTDAVNLTTPKNRAYYGQSKSQVDSRGIIPDILSAYPRAHFGMSKLPLGAASKVGSELTPDLTQGILDYLSGQFQEEPVEQ